MNSLQNINHTLIVFEGLDGCGKTTQIKLLYKFLKKRSKVKLLREPGSTKIGEKIRALLKNQEHVSPLTQLLLFTAARNALLEKLKHQSWDIILLDRYIYSTYAYQGQFVDKSVIDQLQQIVDPIKPTCVFLFLHKKRTHIQDQLELTDQDKVKEIFLQQHDCANSACATNWIIVPNLDIKKTFNFIIKNVENICKINKKA